MPSVNRDIAKILGRTEAANPTNAVLTSTADGSGLVVYETLNDLPTSGLTAGDQAYITSTNRLYVSNGTGWYNVALFNATPTLSISPSGAVTLAVDGSTPTVITLTGADSDTALGTLTYSVESDGSFANIATLSQDSSVFTIIPLSEDSATPGSSTLTFKVSDGISFGAGTTSFSLTFGPDWASPTETKLVASDATYTNAQFGQSVSINSDGTYAIVGSHGEATGGSNAGAAYVFTRSGSTWTQQQKIQASDAAADDWFGRSVSINSDATYAIVGAYKEDFGGTDAGAVYVYVRSGSTWTQQQKMIASDAQANDWFGESVSINSDATYAIVGAEEAGGNGAAYVFTRSGSTWTQQQKLVSSDLADGDRLGKSVSINSDATYAIVGAYQEDPVAGGEGSSYIFTRSGSTWTQQQKITAPNPTLSSIFGWSVSINSDATYAVVGERNSDDPASNAGAAYIFTRSGSTWTHQQKIQSSDIGFGDYFGNSVSINSDATYVVIGAYFERGGEGSPAPGAGAAYVFERDGSTWTEVKKLAASDLQSSDQFGWSVSMSSDGSYAIVGAFTEDGGAGDPISNAGAAYIYEAG